MKCLLPVKELPKKCPKCGKRLKSEKCPLRENGIGCAPLDEVTVKESAQPFKTVEIIEQWSKEHPVKTRMSEFLKLFPNAMLDEQNGILEICPMLIYGGSCEDYAGHLPYYCYDCKEKFWLAPVEEKDE